MSSHNDLSLSQLKLTEKQDALHKTTSFGFASSSRAADCADSVSFLLSLSLSAAVRDAKADLQWEVRHPAVQHVRRQGALLV